MLVFKFETSAKLSYFNNMESKKRLRCPRINVIKMNGGSIAAMN
jgi:hypothetical protein